LAPFYSAAHREAGGYWTENRQHMRVFYPLMGLSLGVVDVQRPQLYNAELLAEMASTAKNRAKRSVSNALCIERRAPLASARQAHTQVS
ncbi:MAG TPA: GGDEF domain-containing protein, partial [Candidatus Paenalcaligenes intestinipullorum]|nr:GGDEF domain-containing protein [Candidatus Paenalcaligenes intestinipullorum]